MRSAHSTHNISRLSSYFLCLENADESPKKKERKGTVYYTYTPCVITFFLSDSRLAIQNIPSATRHCNVEGWRGRKKRKSGTGGADNWPRLVTHTSCTTCYVQVHVSQRPLSVNAQRFAFCIIVCVSAIRKILVFHSRGEDRTGARGRGHKIPSSQSSQPLSFVRLGGTEGGEWLVRWGRERADDGTATSDGNGYFHPLPLSSQGAKGNLTEFFQHCFCFLLLHFLKCFPQVFLSSEYFSPIFGRP